MITIELNDNRKLQITRKAIENKDVQQMIFKYLSKISVEDAKLLLSFIRQIKAPAKNKLEADPTYEEAIEAIEYISKNCVTHPQAVSPVAKSLALLHKYVDNKIPEILKAEKLAKSIGKIIGYIIQTEPEKEVFIIEGNLEAIKLNEIGISAITLGQT